MNKIYLLFKKVIGFLFITLLFHNILWRESSRVINYKELIKGENINKSNTDESQNCKNLKDIESIEVAILTEIKKKSDQKPINNLALNQAKERLLKIEQDYQSYQTAYKEQKVNFESVSIDKDKDSLSKKEAEDFDDYGRSSAWMEFATKKKENNLKEVSSLVVENIKNNLENAKLGINDLNTDYISGNWKERSFSQSLTRDPQRTLLIQPLQLISRKIGFNISSKSLYAFLDILFKVLIIRLVIILISYPPNLELTTGSGENQKPLDNIYTLEEERKLTKERLDSLKNFFFNLGLMISVTFCFYFHPFAFNIESVLYTRQTNFILIIPSVIFSLISGYLMSTYYQKVSFLEYVRKNWIISLIIPSVIFSFIYFSGGIGNQLGKHLPILIGEVVNILIYTVMIAIKKPK